MKKVSLSPADVAVRVAAVADVEECFGSVRALSADGNTLAVVARGEFLCELLILDVGIEGFAPLILVVFKHQVDDHGDYLFEQQDTIP